MFYNSKKLIDEKVLQQYYFEQLMSGKSSKRKKFLPKKYEQYAIEKIIKGLNPEVNIGQNSKSKNDKSKITNHITDFVLYPSYESKLTNLNIELKWDVKDFEKEDERFWHYNGEKSNGFIVAMYNDTYHPETVDNGKIPVVYLCPNEFKKWFTKKAHSIVSQALANKLGSKPTRLSGEKFWITCIVSASNEHYLNHSRPQNIWAFRDNNNPKNIMNILDGDYVIFVRLNHCEPGRAVYSYSNKTNAKFKKSRGGFLLNSEISWSIDLLDIRKVNKGYHLNYSDKPPYHGFDDEWLNSKNKLPETKSYTQFITFNKFNDDEFEYIWNNPKGTVLDRKLFTDDDQNLEEFVDALRTSMNTRGDAIEVSRSSFESILRLVDEL